VQFVRAGLAISLTDRHVAIEAAERGEVHIWPHFNGRLPHHAIALERRMEEKPIAAFFEACKAVFNVGERTRRRALAG
jgi:hypothetical protein